MRLYRHRKNLLTGVWALKKTVWCKIIDYLTYSRYKVSLTLPDYSGRAVSLSDFRDRDNVLLVFNRSFT